MLTIENIHKLRNKTLGKKNFYVEYIKEIFDLDPKGIWQSNHRYVFSITNRTYAIQITLDRSGFEMHNLNVYKLTSSTGKYLYLETKEINNMDIFIDKLRHVGLSKFN